MVYLTLSIIRRTHIHTYVHTCRTIKQLRASCARTLCNVQDTRAGAAAVRGVEAHTEDIVRLFDFARSRRPRTPPQHILLQVTKPIDTDLPTSIFYTDKYYVYEY